MRWDHTGAVIKNRFILHSQGKWKYCNFTHTDNRNLATQLFYVEKPDRMCCSYFLEFGFCCAWRSESDEEYFALGLLKPWIFLEIMQKFWNESVKCYHFRKCGYQLLPHWWIIPERVSGIGAAAFINISLGLTTNPELLFRGSKKRHNTYSCLCKRVDNGWKR